MAEDVQEILGNRAVYSRIFRDFCESFPFREIFKSGFASLSKSRRIHVFPTLSISGGAFARRTLWMRSSRSSMQPAVLSEHTTLCTSQSEAAKQMETKLGYVGIVGIVGIVGYICAIWNLIAVLFDFKCVLRYVSGGARPSGTLPSFLSHSHYVLLSFSEGVCLCANILSFASCSLCLSLIMWFYVCLSHLLPVVMCFPFCLQLSPIISVMSVPAYTFVSHHV